MFYLVWREGSGHAAYRHETQASAAEEAERLALKAPGERFFVLAAVRAVRAHRPVEWEEFSDVPF